jgi:hypothetical protein
VWSGGSTAEAIVQGQSAVVRGGAGVDLVARGQHSGANRVGTGPWCEGMVQGVLIGWRMVHSTKWTHTRRGKGGLWSNRSQCMLE